MIIKFNENLNFNIYAFLFIFVLFIILLEVSKYDNHATQDDFNVVVKQQKEINLLLTNMNNKIDNFQSDVVREILKSLDKIK